MPDRCRPGRLPAHIRTVALALSQLFEQLKINGFQALDGPSEDPQFLLSLGDHSNQTPPTVINIFLGFLAHRIHVQRCTKSIALAMGQRIDDRISIRQPVHFLCHEFQSRWPRQFACQKVVDTRLNKLAAHPDSTKRRMGLYCLWMLMIRRLSGRQTPAAFSLFRAGTALGPRDWHPVPVPDLSST